MEREPRALAATGLLGDEQHLSWRDLSQGQGFLTQVEGPSYGSKTELNSRRLLYRLYSALGPQKHRSAASRTSGPTSH